MYYSSQRMTDSEQEEVRCNLCGSGRWTVLYHHPHRLNAASECVIYAATTDEYQNYGRIVRCRDCGLAYTNPRPTAAALLNGYVECVDEAYLAESSSRSINAHLSLNTLKRFVKSGRLLEVGSSAGYFLNAARIDFDVVGLEPSAWASRFSRDRFKLEVHPESFDSTRRFEKASLDAVAMIDVIEHLPDPRSMVQKASELLKPGGVLYLVTPDIGSLSARLLREYWWGLRPAHIYYFNKRTLRKLLEEEGFEIALMKSFGRIFSWGHWAGRLRHYPSFIHGTALRLIRAFGVEEKPLYLDTRDSLEVCARRR